MLSVGLTGGIGSGKSTAANRLRDLGAVVIDADAVARDVLAEGSPGLAAVLERFGADVLDDTGSLDRSRLAGIVFGDPGARAALEEITHPLIAERTRELVGEMCTGKVFVHDVPLLVEKRLAPQYHLVAIVDTPSEQRLARLVDERGMPEADARARMAHQATDEERREVADILLDNSGTVQDLCDRVEAAWHQRIMPYEHNLRTGTVVRRFDIPVLCDYDDDWRCQAQRLIARLSATLGESAPEIEHVGSTSVPGMEGKDVIDLQVGVARLPDADDPAFVATLAELGFPRIDDYRMDHPTDDLPDPSLWVKRFHGSCDPGRIVHLHVREIASAGWQYALLFRDWLRADPHAAAEYVQVKRRLADRTADAGEYARAKEPWFNEIWPRMQSWAQHTGWQA